MGEDKEKEEKKEREGKKAEELIKVNFSCWFLKFPLKRLPWSSPVSCFKITQSA